MRVLLDTETFLYAATAWHRLSARAREVLDDRGNELVLSTVSIWECATKATIGKLLFEPDVSSWVQDQITVMRLEVLPVLFRHCDAYAGLPFSAEHRDPFDRMIVAQAISEEMPLVASDRAFRQYDVEIIW